MANHFGGPGAVRKGRKKGSTIGSGGKTRGHRKSRGPTPKAENRTYHPAYKRKKELEEKAAKAKTAQLRKILQIPKNHELVVGRNPVLEAVEAGVNYLRLFLVHDFENDERITRAAVHATEQGIPIVEVSRRELDRMSEQAVHQGIAIEVPPYKYADVQELVDISAEKARPGLIVALDSVTDPHNLGAVIRSAAAFNADGVLIPERRSAGVNVTAWKVSAGALAHVPVARETNLVRALQYLQEAGYFVVGLTGEADAMLREVNLADMPLVIVTGAEGKGLSRLVAEQCDVRAAIEINSQVDSLNAAVATGIALYEIDGRRAGSTQS